MIFDNENFAINYKKFHSDSKFKYHDIFLEKYIEDGAYVSRGLTGTKYIVKYNDDNLVELLIEELYAEDDESELTECITTTLYNYYDGNNKNFAYAVDIEITNFDHSTGVENFIGFDKSLYKNTYDGDLLVRVENNLGYVEELQYDAEGLLFSTKNPNKPHTYYNYNDRGLTTSIMSGNYETIFEYDEQDRITHKLKLKNEDVEYGMQYSYNEEGLLSGVVDLEGNSEEYLYDNEGRIIEMYLDDMLLEIEYDEHGHLSTVYYDNGYVEEWDFRADGVLMSYGDNEGEVFINDAAHYALMNTKTTFEVNTTVH